MKDAAPTPVYLKDYRPFGWEVGSVELTFRLQPGATRVTSRIDFKPRDGGDRSRFFLHGEGLRLITAAIDGQPVETQAVEGGLTCPVPEGPFTWEAEVEIDPEGNTALEGLYISKGIYATQCEAEGFRKITFYPDRPDVMSVFTVRIEGDQPVLLSNGNEVERGDGFAVWHDPWPKPAYLFALVAGDLRAVSGTFRTMSGRDVALNIWVRAGDEDKCDWALASLKKAMRWDEDEYGREYDLDVFNIVAIDDFNAGAMENKGLNLFNSALVLASPETATDRDFERIEAVIAHEYFHNWTGNRITCRDWFQLCLKEGLTVFRDQQFTGDMRSEPVKRIEDVIVLRAHQFKEDSGPLAHPVRPESFVEINNFYTLTVYEKGAELVGMLRRLVGEDGYRAALDLYFERHDGDAATVEDWLKVFEDATGRDLTQYKRWYAQAGTPRLTVRDHFEDGVYTLDFEQQTRPTPGQETKEPQVIPIAVGLLNPNGDEVVPTTVLEMTEARQSFRFEGLAARPVPSILRGFSAPVILDRHTDADERAFLLAHDTDPFNRWEAGRALTRDLLHRIVTEGQGADAAYLDGLRSVVRDDTLDPAFRALVLSLPEEDETAQHLHEAGVTPDPQAIHEAHEALKVEIAQGLQDTFARVRAEMAVEAPYSPDAEQAGKRALGNAILSYLSRIDGGSAAKAQFAAADNMTTSLAALGALLSIGKGEAELAAFEKSWRHERLVMDKWFSLQVGLAEPDRAADLAETLTGHDDFDWRNPNRFRALFGGLARNRAGFHHASGEGYRLLADWLIRLDPVNPQTAARMTSVYSTWRRYGPERQARMRAELERIRATPGLSRDTGEMVDRMLA